MDTLTKKLPFLHIPHSEDYDGIPELAALKIVPGYKGDKEDFIIITVNVLLSRSEYVAKPDNIKGTLQYLDVDKVPDEVMMEIVNGWDKDIPLHIWCEINGLTKNMPVHCWDQIYFSSIQRVHGPIHYFNFETIKKKRKKISRENQHDGRKHTSTRLLEKEVQLPRSGTTATYVKPIQESIPISRNNFETRIDSWLRRRRKNRTGYQSATCQKKDN